MLRIAVRMLMGDTTKFLGVVLGVLFCTFLSTHMLSLFSGMMVRSFALVSDIPQADIWVMDAAVEYTDEPAGLAETALRRVQGVGGVRWAVPLFTGNLRARLPSGRVRGVLVIGLDDATLVGAPERLLTGSLEDLRRSDAVFADAAGARTLLRMPIAPIARQPGWVMPDLSPETEARTTRPLAVGDELLVNDHRLIVTGMAQLGTRLIAKPVLYTTYTRALAIAPPERNLMSFILVKAAAGQDQAELCQKIQRTTGLRARTSRQFEEDTFWYFVRTTGVVGRIIFMVAISTITGSAISGLLLYLFTSDNLRYYAVLKALGMLDGTILKMIAVQAAISGAVGYGLGTGLSVLLSHVVSRQAMPYLLMWWTLVFTAVSVVLVCTASALLSARRVMKLEPAIVFK